MFLNLVMAANITSCYCFQHMESSERKYEINNVLSSKGLEFPGYTRKKNNRLGVKHKGLCSVSLVHLFTVL